MITAIGLRVLPKGALQGFVDLELRPSRLVLRGCTLMESNGRRWIGLPGRPQTQRDGAPVIDPKTGKPAWAPVVEIRDKEARERFQTAALAAVDRLLGADAPP
jgi:hypothetical protein